MPQPSRQGASLVDFVNSGGRIIVVPYCFSILVMSFRRSMGNALMVTPGNWPMGNAIGASLISVCFGWWGVPWGLIFTPMCLIQLWNGGNDVTRKVLAQSVGDAQARQILAGAPKPPKPGSIWAVRAIILLPVLAVLGLFFGAAKVRSEREDAPLPSSTSTRHHRTARPE